MARSSLPISQTQTNTRITFSRLLTALDNSLSSSSTELRQDPYARAKFGANLEYARGLLLTLENESSSNNSTNNSAIQKVKSGLQREKDGQTLAKEVRKRIRELNERLHELAVEGEDEEESEIEEEVPVQEQIRDEPSLNEKIGLEEPTLRNRGRGIGNGSERDQLLGKTTSTSLQHPPSTNSKPSKRTSNIEIEKKDSELSQAQSLEKQESEQASLTSSLVEMAQALRQSTKQFSQTLENEKSTLDRTGEGLQRNKDGLDSAGKKMGTLRKMTEGRGWYGRLLIYGYIAGLWVLAIALLFLPKLRF